jgi:hypothetical protein
MPHTTRMSYKAKWLAVAGMKGMGDQAGRLQRCQRDIEAAKADVRAMRQAHVGLAEKHMTLAGALQDAAAVCNEFLDVGILSFKPVQAKINIESAADIVMAATAIVTQMADRFGLVCAGLEEIAGDNDTDGTIAALREEIEGLSSIVTRSARPGRPRDLDTSRIVVAGKRLKFEALSPINESPRWGLISDEDTDAATAPRGRTSQSEAKASSPAVSADAAVESEAHVGTTSGFSAVERRTSSTARPGPLPSRPPQSLWPSFERGSGSRAGASPSPGKGKERVTLPASRSRSSTPSKSATAAPQKRPPSPEDVSSRPGVDYRAEIALLDDVDWENVRASLNRTDQLTVRGLGPADLASLVVDDPRPNTARLRGTSVTARLRSALRSVSAVKRAQRST